jgi:hypothetical protein
MSRLRPRHRYRVHGVYLGKEKLGLLARTPFAVLFG